MMTRQQFRDVAWGGLWKQNPGLAQLLGLCPILAVSTSVVNAVSLGLATVLVMAVANLAVASLRNFIPYEIRIPVFILIIAALVTMVDLAFNAYMHSLYLVLGIFIPLIVTNCIVLARVEAYAAKNEGFKIIDEQLGAEQYGIAFRSDDADLCKAVEDAVAALVENGTYKEIADKYPDIVNNLLFLN